jgi:O-antigen ligase
MKLPLRRLINYIVIFTIFSGGLTLTRFHPFFDLRIIYFLLPLILLFWLPFFKNTYFDKSLLWFYSIFIIIIFFSIINVFFGNNSFLLLSKQVIGILLTSLVFFLLFKINNYDVEKIFKIYLNIAFIVALIGLLQIISFLLNFELGYNFSYLFPSWRLALTQTGFLRVNSILSEPTSFCYVIMPAFFASIVSLIRRRYALLKTWKAIIIIGVFLLTFSTIGYIGFFLALALLIYNYNKARHLLLIGLILFSCGLFLWNYIGDVRTRVSDSMEVVTGKTDLEDANLSTFALFSNALVTYKVFLDSPFFGHGLGSRPISYDKYIEDVINVERVKMFLNREGGNSLFLRILSEMGLFGIVLFFCFLFKFYLSKIKDKTDYLWVISSAVLVMFLIRLIRAEHYFNGGMFFFFWL